MSWWVLQILGCALLIVPLTMARELGLCLQSYIALVIVNLAFTGWMFPLSYSISPSFFQVWFLGIAASAIFGGLSSAFYFGEAITLKSIAGVLLSLCGAVLLVI